MFFCNVMRHYGDMTPRGAYMGLNVYVMVLAYVIRVGLIKNPYV